MNENLATAKRLIPVVQLIQVRLLGCSSKHHRWPNDGEEMQVFMKWDVRSPMEIAENQFDVRANLEALVSSKDDDQEPPFRLSAEFSLVYGVPEGFTATAEELLAFAEVNGIFNAWPYFREITQNMAARMNLPPLVVPLYRLPLQAAPSAERPAVLEAKPEEKTLGPAESRVEDTVRNK